MAADNASIMDKIPDVPQDEFTVYGTVYAFPEHADALEAVYTASTRQAASEEGIIYYCISRDPDDRDVFHFFERYSGRKAFEAHVSTPLMVQLFKDKYIKEVKARFAKPIMP
ncbi:hypothetical protein B0H66DRAFT_568836 [Apodospora peruviana]|uniref:ABM domain-containing protein n=1 Tax=Apodospora peruviana TaxID=516989 RepID=A0AAE0HTR2_9PEZI|nr:hypothetical protein B0H66DRAFT_568836 [Apodospora peruviana]